MPTVLITGANRGIGLEFTRQYAARGWDVLATCRDPAQALALQEIFAAHSALRLERLDLTRQDEIEGLAERCAGISIDVLLNNAALLGPGGPQLLGSFSDDAFLDAFRANALGPARFTETMLPAVLGSQQKKIIFLGSAAGATGLLRPPANLYAYRASKAALHLIARNLSLDLKDRGVTVGLVNPGLTDTRGLLDLAPDDPGPADLQQVVKLMRAGILPVVRPEVSVAGMMQLIDAWTLGRTGEFLNYDGQPLPW